MSMHKMVKVFGKQEVDMTRPRKWLTTLQYDVWKLPVKFQDPTVYSC